MRRRRARRPPRRRSRMWPTSAPRSRAPRGSMPRARKPRAHRARHLLRRDQRQPEHPERALRTSTRAACRRAWRRTRTGGARGRRCCRASHRWRRRWPGATRRRRRASAAGDQRFNHWTAVRNGLMNAHAELFARIPEIVRMLPDEIDQMKVFQLIQIIPSPTRRALASGNFAGYAHFRSAHHGLPAQQLACSPSARPTARGHQRHLPRDPRRHVAVHREVRARAGDLRGDQARPRAVAARLDGGSFGLGWHVALAPPARQLTFASDHSMWLVTTGGD